MAGVLLLLAFVVGAALVEPQPYQTHGPVSEGRLVLGMAMAITPVIIVCGVTALIEAYEWLWQRRRRIRKGRNNHALTPHSLRPRR